MAEPARKLPTAEILGPKPGRGKIFGAITETIGKAINVNVTIPTGTPVGRVSRLRPHPHCMAITCTLSAGAPSARVRKDK